jgi:hypothetical protein
MNMAALGYIDPNTSQHVFSLLGPILACATAMGGLAITAVVFVRCRIVSYFRRASWASRVTTVSVVIGGLAIITVVTWWIIS